MLPHWRTPDNKILNPPSSLSLRVSTLSCIYLYRKRRTIELLRASFMYRDSCCHTYRTTGDMENGNNTYGHGHSYTSDSFSTDRGQYRNINVATAHHASWDAVGGGGGGGGGGSGSGSYFTSLPRFDWTNNPSSAAYAPTVNGHGGFALPADPHLTCLQLGKRHSFEYGSGVVASSALSDGGRRGRRGCCSGGVMGLVRCQVEGCETALGSAKEYHRRHRVCEVHAKAPIVVVMGRHQRFCQQCSRFHALSEFDESKRSCRRRLAGHNERRRKSSHDSVPRARASYQGGALSLLSSRTDTCEFSPSDLSLRCSAALRELIAEHRATILAHQLVLDRSRLESDSNKTSFLESKCLHHARFPGLPTSERAEASSQVTLDLMQGTSSAFGLLSMSARQQQHESCELWNSFEDV